MGLIDTLKTKPVWMNLAAMVGVFLVLVFVLLFWANIYTRHGEKITVPNYVGQSFTKLEDEGNDFDFEFVITDSTYEEGKPGGLILDQDPKPGSFVKEGRKIYVSVSAFDVPQVSFPLKENLSVRMANALLANAGLKVGTIEEKPVDMISRGSYVLESTMGNRKLKYGDKIPRGSTINLLVAVASLDSFVNTPSLTGLGLREAAIYMSNSSCTWNVVGGLSGMDSTAVYIYKQKPDAHFIDQVRVGSNIEVWVRPESERPAENTETSNQ